MPNKDKKPFVKGYKYRIYPTAEQKQYLAKIFGNCRFIYNHLLSKCIEDYQTYLGDKQNRERPNVTGIGLCYHVTEWKHLPEYHWLKDSPAQVIQQPAHHLAAAFMKFFKEKKGYPRYKSKHGQQSVTFTTQSYTLTGKVFKTAKCDMPYDVRWSRDLPTDRPGPCTITKTPSGKYFVSFMCEFTPEKTSGQGVIGIDAGITDLATLSDGTCIENPRHYIKLQRKLRIHQRRLSRKKKGSSNRNKARFKVAKIHEKIANCRRDYLHKFTTRIVRENQAIGIETLQVANMARNRRLAKHIMDAGWVTMRTQLMYKCINSQFTKLILADPYFPSTQLCHVCLVKPAIKLKLDTRKWTCLNCNTVHQRDNNAAMNLAHLASGYLTLDRPERIYRTNPYRPHRQ